MAEIKIQPKSRGASWWPWLLLLLIPLLWFMLRGRKDETVARDTTVATTPVGSTVGPATTTTTTTTTTAVTEYGTFVGTTPAAERDETAQHQYTADGIRRLAAAIDANPHAGGVSAQTATMRAMADSIQATAPASTRHADMTRAAFDAAVVAMRGIGVSSLSGVESAAKGLRPGATLVSQRAGIQRFFEAARDALQATAGAPAPAVPAAPARP